MLPLMTTTLSAFLAEVEAFLGRSGLPASTFGARALNDPQFVFDLRAGRAVRLTTVDRVRAFIAAEDAALEAKHLPNKESAA
jgi:hypothetical protein